VPGGVAGGLLAGFVNMGLARAFGPLHVGSPGHVMTVGPAMILPQSMLPGFLAAFLLQSCDPLDRRGRAMFLIMSAWVLLISFALPLSTGLDAKTVWVLSSMHVTTALGVLVGLWLAMPGRVNRAV